MFSINLTECLYYSVDISSTDGGDPTNIRASFYPNFTFPPTHVKFEVLDTSSPCTACELDKTFVVTLTASAFGATSIQYSAATRQIKHIC